MGYCKVWIVFSVATGPNRLIDRVVETRREVCFAPPAPSRLSTWLVLHNYYQLLSHFFCRNIQGWLVTQNTAHIDIHIQQIFASIHISYY